jgi:prophage regulatory protein
MFHIFYGKLPRAARRVLDMTGLSHSVLYEMIGRGEFPAPVKIGLRGSAWLAEEVNKWIEARVAERDAKLPKRRAA